jgi:hypothetical protein
MDSSDVSMRRMTGWSAIVAVVLWLAIFPLYVQADPSVSFYDGGAIARDFLRLRNVVFTRMLLGLALYPALLIFAVGYAELVRRADNRLAWVSTLLVASISVWLGVTLVANGLEGGIVLDALRGGADPSVARALTMGYLLVYNGSIAFVMTAMFLATAGYAAVAAEVLPRWTTWLAFTGSILCLACVPAMYVGPVDPTGIYNAGGWGVALVANFPPLFWFLAVGVLLVHKRPVDA